MGVGGVGFGQLQACEKAGFQIVALCDVDDVYAKKAYDRWRQARRHRDFREMLSAEGPKVDAVYCGTPDHSDAVITLAALRRKKHVCCVKPLTRTIHECRHVVETAPLASMVTYEFPARGAQPPVRVVWYDGGLKPPYPVELAGQSLGESGTLYAGDEGKMLDTTILPASRAAKFANVPKTLPRRSGTWGEWYDACRGGESAGCNFDWAGPLTEFVLLGNIALRTDKCLTWDAEHMRFTNDTAADAYIQEPYRTGWSLDA